MGKGYKHGAGGGANVLNFDVVSYTTEAMLLAATPKENTIGIITNQNVAGYTFSPDPPENVTDGHVWISTGTSSAVEFNALKKNSIQIFPQAAKQLADGAWADVTAKSYLGGEWVPWGNGVLYDNGDQYTGITGGWIATHDDAENYIEFASDSIKFKDSGGTISSCAVYTNNTVDISDYSTLRMVCDITMNYEAISFGITASKGAADPAFKRFKSPSANGSHTLDLDISAQTGEFYVAVTGKYSVFSIYKIQLL